MVLPCVTISLSVSRLTLKTAIQVGIRKYIRQGARPWKIESLPCKHAVQKF